MTAAPFLCVIPQRGHRDCAAACLAMLLGVTYERALLAFGDELLDGADTRMVQRAARKLGAGLHLTKQIDLENDTGMLRVGAKDWPNDHMVVLKEGLIVDPDATLWDADVFLAVYEATAVSLLTVE